MAPDKNASAYDNVLLSSAVEKYASDLRSFITKCGTVSFSSPRK